MNVIHRSNGITIIIGNHDHIASRIDFGEPENRLRNALISRFVRQVNGINTPVLNGDIYLRELQGLVIADRNTRPRYNDGGLLIAHQLPLQLRANNQLNETNNWHRR